MISMGTFGRLSRSYFREVWGSGPNFRGAVLLPQRRFSSESSGAATVVFIRHGQSTWNKIPTFTGWCDVPLTDHGVDQAKEAGTLLRERGYGIDVAYSSELKRAKISCEAVIEGMEQNIPIETSWKLNERHYGVLQGRAKDDPSLVKEYGEAQLVSWRREFLATPPPMNETHPYYEPPPAPRTESLADCQKRVLEFWHTSIVPTLDSGQCALLVAHANTLRAMTAYLDETRPEDIPKIHIPNSVPCVYQIDLATGKAMEASTNTLSSGSKGASKGHWLLSQENQRRLAEKLGASSESFAQSLFDAWDRDSDGILSQEELARGLYTWKNLEDRALAAVVGKMWEELHKVGDGAPGPVTLEKFKHFVLMGAKRHNLPFFLAS